MNLSIHSRIYLQWPHDKSIGPAKSKSISSCTKLRPVKLLECFSGINGLRFLLAFIQTEQFFPWK